MNKNEPFQVGKSFRTNPLSKTEGGSTVIVKMKDGKLLSYDNIKNTDAYIRSILNRPDVKTAWVK